MERTLNYRMMRRTPPGSRRVGALPTVLAVLAVALLGASLLALFALPGASPPAAPAGTTAAPAASTAAAASALHVIVTVESGNSSMVNYVLNNVAPILLPGDTIDLNHDPSLPITTAEVQKIDSEAVAFQKAAPAGVIISAHSGFLPLVGALDNGSTPPISEIAATDEPINGVTPSLSGNFTQVLSYFNEATKLAHAKGFSSVAYPTARFLLDAGVQQYHWDYSAIAKTSDLMWVETQRYALDNLTQPGIFGQALDKLVSQMNAGGAPLSKLAIQVDVGIANSYTVTPGVPPAVAVQDIHYAQSMGISNVYLWPMDAYESYLPITIQDLNRTAVPPTAEHSVTFTESGLPSGTLWSVTVNGTLRSSVSTSISFPEPNGSYAYTVTSPTLPVNGSRFVATPPGGSVVVRGTNVTTSVLFGAQYWVGTAASPVDSGATAPASGWFAAGAPVSLQAVATSGNRFVAWTGQGPGNYSGADNPVSITVRGSINETAEFVGTAGNGSLVPVVFVETGLPNGTSWNVSLNGEWRSSNNSTIVFTVPNGSYAFEVGNPVQGSNATGSYVTNVTQGTVVASKPPVVVSVSYLAPPVPPGQGGHPAWTPAWLSWLEPAALLAAVLGILLGMNAVVRTVRRGRRRR